jgi:hypothetical protein
MTALFWFPAGIVVGAIFGAALRPVIIRLWKRFLAWINRQPEDPT